MIKVQTQNFHELAKQNSHSKLSNKNDILTRTETKQLKLKKAAEEFESIFVNQLLKSMRTTSFTEKQDGFGKDIMLSIADEAVSKQISSSGSLGIAKLLYEKIAEKISGSEEITSLFPQTNIQQISKNSKNDFMISEIDYLIGQASKKYDLSPKLISAIIKQESGGNPHAVSNKGAAGLMQLMPDTAQSLGVTDSFNPKQNIFAGAKYIRSLLDQFGDVKLALAAYNAGPGRVKEYNGIPPFKETRQYIDNIMADLKETKRVNSILKVPK